MIDLKASTHRFRNWWSRYGRRTIITASAVLVVIVLAVQFLYPTDRLVPFSKVDGVSLGWDRKIDAEAELDEAYQAALVDLSFNQAKEPYRQAAMAELGIAVSNEGRLDEVSYPWYMRIIPGSLFFAHFIQAIPAVEYQRDEAVLTAYIDENFGDPCDAPTTNASLSAQDGRLELVRGATGGDCTVEEVRTALDEYVPLLTNTSVNLRGNPVDPAVSNADATRYAEKLLHNLKNTIVLKIDNQTFEIPAKEVMSWLGFTPGAEELQYVIDEQKASDYLLTTMGEKVAIPAGTTVTTLRNFVEAARKDGANGRILDVAATLDSIRAQLDNGTPAALVTQQTQPEVTYDFTFAATNEKLANVMKNYAQTHRGSYAATLIEISKDGRFASYNGTKQFMTASTYKLFVAYSTLLRIESGEFKWSEPVSNGRNLSQCFDDMIELSDNACAEAFIRKIGMPNLTNEAKAIGCTQTIFASGNIRSTTEDQTRLLGLLHTGRVLSEQANRDKLFTAMKANVYREGIPKGLPGITVANKVGFLDELLHDSAIVHSSTGVYVLSIYTANASWGDIAELAKQLQTARV